MLVSVGISTGWSALVFMKPFEFQSRLGLLDPGSLGAWATGLRDPHTREVSRVTKRATIWELRS